jgi:hypothetical protein
VRVAFRFKPLRQISTSVEGRVAILEVPDPDDKEVVGTFTIMVGATTHEKPVTIAIMADKENRAGVLENVTADKDPQVTRREFHV